MRCGRRFLRAAVEVHQAAKIGAGRDAIERCKLHFAEHVVLDEHAAERLVLAENLPLHVVVDEPQVQARDAEEDDAAVGLPVQDDFSK